MQGTTLNTGLHYNDIQYCVPGIKIDKIEKCTIYKNGNDDWIVEYVKVKYNEKEYRFNFENCKIKNKKETRSVENNKDTSDSFSPEPSDSDEDKQKMAQYVPKSEICNHGVAPACCYTTNWYC